jgi:hypothetical protein
MIEINNGGFSMREIISVTENQSVAKTDKVILRLDGNGLTFTCELSWTKAVEILRLATASELPPSGPVKR